MEIALLVICIDLPPGGISNYDNTGTKLGDFFLICKYYLPPRIIASEPGYQVFVPASLRGFAKRGQPFRLDSNTRDDTSLTLTYLE